MRTVARAIVLFCRLFSFSFFRRDAAFILAQINGRAGVNFSRCFRVSQSGRVRALQIGANLLLFFLLSKTIVFTARCTNATSRNYEPHDLRRDVPIRAARRALVSLKGRERGRQKENFFFGPEVVAGSLESSEYCVTKSDKYVTVDATEFFHDRSA